MMRWRTMNSTRCGGTDAHLRDNGWNPFINDQRRRTIYVEATHKETLKKEERDRTGEMIMMMMRVEQRYQRGNINEKQNEKSMKM